MLYTKFHKPRRRLQDLLLTMFNHLLSIMFYGFLAMELLGIFNKDK